MSTTPQLPTAVALSERAPRVDGRVVEAARAGPATLRVELDAIVARLHDSAQRRSALLDVMLRQRRIVGGVWFDIGSGEPAPLVTRLLGPALDRTTLREWIANIARGLNHQGELREVPSPEVRNLSALALVVRRDEAAEAVILLATNSAAKPLQEEWLALQQLGMAWESAALLSRVRECEVRTRLAAALLDLSGRVQGADSVREACQSLVQVLQEHFRCGLVAVGLCRPGERAPKLVATSDGVEADPHGMQVQRIEAALAECVIADQLMLSPQSDRSGSPPALAHKRLTAVLGAEAVVSAPLHAVGQDFSGAVLCVGEAATLLAATTQDFLQAAAEPIGGALATVRRHEGGRWRRLGRAIAGGATKMRAAALVLAVSAAIGGLMIPVPYRISAGCRLEPQVRRLSPAPFDGLLEATHAAPGDVVAKGQLLATMDGREVEWELAGVVADQHRAAKERDSYLATHEVSRSLMAALEVERLAAREALLRVRLARLEIASPIDGIVLSGSLDRRENVPVTAGQSLYEIAPLATLRLEVEAPADEVSHVREGMAVEVRMHGMASDPRTGVIERIRPASEVRDGRNVFVAEVALDNSTGELRPGMTGSVRITGDAHPLGWNLFHRPWEYLRTRLL